MIHVGQIGNNFRKDKEMIMIDENANPFREKDLQINFYDFYLYYKNKKSGKKLI